MAVDPKIKYDILANVTGDRDVNTLATALDKLDESVDPSLAGRAKVIADSLRNLGNQRDAIDRFVELKRGTQEAGAAMAAAQASAQQLAREIAATGAPTRAQTGQMEKLRDAVRSSKQAYQDQVAQLQAQRSALQRAGVDTGNLAQAQKTIQKELQTTLTYGQRLVEGYKQQATAAQASAGQQVRAHRQISGSIDEIGKKLDGLRNFSVGAILGGQAAQAIKSVTETADAFDNLSARIKLAVGEGANFLPAMKGVEGVALRTHSSLEATANLFTKIMVTNREMGLSAEEAQSKSLELTETINRAIQLSGATSQAASASLNQFVQGLQAGVLRGDEFNSVMEQFPRFSRAIADGLGVTIGQLRTLANEGKLSASVILGAINSQTAAIEEEFKKLPITVGRAIENLSTQWTIFIGGLNQATGATSYLAGGISLLADNLENIGRVAGVAGAALTASLAVKGATALRTFALEAAAAAGASSLLTASLSKIPTVINVAVAATGFEVGWQIGEMLNDNSEYARKLGVFLVGFFENLINDLRLLAEAGAAIFNDDTISEAFDRYRQRGKEMDGIFADMWKNAENVPSKVSEAADAAAESTEKMSGAAQAAAGKTQAASNAAAASVGKIGQAAETAHSAFEALSKSVNKNLPAVNAELEKQAEALAMLSKESKELVLKIGDEIPAAIAKLSGQDLENFRTAFVQAFGQATSQSNLLKVALNEVGRRAAEALGVDVVKASNRLSEGFVQAEKNLSILIRSLDGLSDAGYDTGLILKEAIEKMASAARSESEVEALRRRILTLGQAGQISKAQMVDMFDTVSRKADELKQGINSTAEALAVFGLKSQAELNKVADNFRAAWEQIKSDETISLTKRQQAFSQYADAVVAANDGVVSEQLKQEAALVKIELQAGKAGEAFTESMRAAAGATQGANSELQRTQDLLKKIYDQQVANAKLPPSQIRSSAQTFGEQVAAGEKQRQQDRIDQGRTPTPSDNTGLSSLLEKKRNGTLSSADLPVIQATFDALSQNLLMVQRAMPGTFSLEGARSVESDYNAAKTLLDQFGGSSAGGSRSGISSRGRTIRLELGSGFGRDVNVASQRDADNLDDFFNRLQQDMKRAIR